MRRSFLLLALVAYLMLPRPAWSHGYGMGYRQFVPFYNSVAVVGVPVCYTGFAYVPSVSACYSPGFSYGYGGCAPALAPAPCHVPEAAPMPQPAYATAGVSAYSPSYASAGYAQGYGAGYGAGGCLTGVFASRNTYGSLYNQGFGFAGYGSRFERFGHVFNHPFARAAFGHVGRAAAVSVNVGRALFAPRAAQVRVRVRVR